MNQFQPTTAYIIYNSLIMYLPSPRPPLLVIITIFNFLIIPISASLSFNFNSFSPDDDRIRYDRAYATNNVIQLTANVSEVARATYSEPMRLWDEDSGNLADFTTYFSFVIDSQNRNDSADGTAFFLASVRTRLPSDKRGGGSLGLTEMDKILNSTSNPFVAVEFDIFQNEWDPEEDHVGIDINSLKSVNNTTWWSSTLDGKKNEAWISYDSSSKNLSVVTTGFASDGTVVRQSLYHIVDLRDHLPEWVAVGFSASTGTEYVRQSILSWSLNSTLQSRRIKKKTNLKLWVILGTSLGGTVLIGLMILLALCKKSNKKKNTNGSEREPKKFSLKELVLATNNFADGNMIGKGGFGGVYRGYLRELNELVAVKMKSRDSKQGIKEYKSEVKTISGLRNMNLVKLIGWCNQRKGLLGSFRKEKVLLLVYEFMPNGSLYSHLFNENSSLTWDARYKIAQGLASALLYLHEEWKPNRYVVHRDIKSSNVMLDSNFNAKLGDFGMARVVNSGQQVETSVVAGTIGYIAPECLNLTIRKESDVYSFGVVALEIACGRKAIEPLSQFNQTNLVNCVRELYEMRNHLAAADPRLGTNFNKQEMERLLIVGLWCANPDWNARPSIRDVTPVLNSSDAPLPQLPKLARVPTSIAAAPTTASSTSSSLHYDTASSMNTNASSHSSSTSYAIATESTQSLSDDNNISIT